MRKYRSLPLLIVLALILAAASYAFAAAVTVPPSTAGEGQEIIYGAAATNVHYTLGSGNPSVINSVQFTLTPQNPLAATAVVTAGISGDGGTTWTTSNACTAAGTTYTCTFGTAPIVTTANRLRITVAD